jgi:hypothetical protein
MSGDFLSVFALRAVLAEGVSIGAPPYWQRFAGGDVVHLEFTGRVGDLITLDDRLAIAKLDVLIRPLRAIEALQEVVAPQMTKFFASRNHSG